MYLLSNTALFHGGMARYLLAIVFVSLLFIFPVAASSASSVTGYPYMTEGRGKITDDHDGRIESRIINATDTYIIYSEFSNPAEQPVDLVRVHYVINVIDHEGYSHFWHESLWKPHSAKSSHFWLSTFLEATCTGELYDLYFSNLRLGDTQTTLHNCII